MPESSIALATSRDLDDLLALVSACIVHLRRRGIEQWDEVYPARAIAGDVRSGTAFVACRAGKAVGMLALNADQEPEYAEVPWQLSAGPIAVVHRLMVHPAMQGQGLARALMSYAEARAATLGYRTVRLDAFTQNPRALALYERLGYRDAGQVRLRNGLFRCFEKALGAAAKEPFDSQPTLHGKLVLLRPLRPEDHADLQAAAADPLIWEQHPDKNRHEETGFRQFFAEALASGGALLVTDAQTQRVIGSSRFHGYSEERSEVEIGWTFLARSHWGGRYNGELKQLMLRHAFRFVDSVVFFISPQNIRSQRAVEKIGGVLEAEADAKGRLVYRIAASTTRRKAR